MRDKFGTDPISPTSISKGQSDRTDELIRLRRQINKDSAKLKGSQANLTNFLNITKFHKKQERGSKTMTSNQQSQQSPKEKKMLFNHSSSKMLKVYKDFSASQQPSALNSH